ncbi:histone deacetylase [cf. Phormidesmis sp. LEGE 11477]|uniref:histone deacetylase family protein n=1 Tax=cf. Phormidesmis sp. LEGE 11477 TaxID=1828680 RepID=UPI00187F64A6|nr:histone deacetylase [cf. Phormidesmis sp. LEGE 11477]MBE9062005.1 histone deacetylase [cf. Phormidesmis sp. LEGE 11477]
MKLSFPVFYSNLFTHHNTGAGHPENAGRLRAAVNYLRRCQQSESDDDAWARRIEWIEPSSRPVLDHIYRVHNQGYVRALKKIADGGGGQIDSDTVVSAQSYDVAILAVAAWLDGLDWVCQHRAPAFALVRPPGHHAESDRGMGFCLLSNAAIAAHYAINTSSPNASSTNSLSSSSSTYSSNSDLPDAAAGPDKLASNRSQINKVAILDWDVHHGNGTQHLIEANSQLAYCSFHQSPAYPGTGQANETGKFNNVLNLPVPPGAQLSDYQKLWYEYAYPFLSDFGADLLIVSAGYDANQADPLAGVCLQPDDYGWFAQACQSLTPAVLFGLEGGYDYAALSESIAATIRAAA